MAKKSLISVRFEVPKLIALKASMRKELVSSETVNEFNQTVIPEIKRFIGTGNSPVKGFRRFQSYKDKVKYPGKKKPSKPVNLELTGKTLAQYKAEADSVGIRIGISKSAGAFEKNKAEWNNVGTDRIPSRRIVPLDNETFAVSILRTINKIISKRMQKVFSKK